MSVHLTSDREYLIYRMRQALLLGHPMIDPMIERIVTLPYVTSESSQYVLADAMPAYRPGISGSIPWTGRASAVGGRQHLAGSVGSLASDAGGGGGPLFKFSEERVEAVKRAAAASKGAWTYDEDFIASVNKSWTTTDGGVPDSRKVESSKGPRQSGPLATSNSDESNSNINAAPISQAEHQRSITSSASFPTAPPSVTAASNDAPAATGDVGAVLGEYSDGKNTEPASEVSSFRQSLVRANREAREAENDIDYSRSFAQHSIGSVAESIHVENADQLDHDGDELDDFHDEDHDTEPDDDPHELTSPDAVANEDDESNAIVDVDADRTIDKRSTIITGSPPRKDGPSRRVSKVNRQSAVLNRQSTVLTRQSNVVTRKSTIGQTQQQNQQQVIDSVIAKLMDNHEENEDDVLADISSEKELKDLFQKKPIQRMLSYAHPPRHSSGVPPGLPAKSALSLLMQSQNSSDNPFAAEYSFFAGKGEPNPMRIQIYIPSSSEPFKPLLVIVKRDATVEEVIGYSLYEYTNASREPPIPEELLDVSNWNMRIVEDDGAIDEDFPALERTRKIEKFSFDQFAVCQASPEQVKSNSTIRQLGATRPTAQKISMPSTTSNTGPIVPAGHKSVTATSSNSASSTQPRTVLLKVHLYSTLEVKQTTTIPVQSHMLMSEIFEVICRKRKYDSKNYVLRMPDTRTDVPMDRTLEALRVTEFCVLKRDRGGAGDIFLRPPDEVSSMDRISLDNSSRFISEEYASMYKQYAVTHKQLMGRHERVLTIDGDNIHLMTPENKKVFDIMKTTSHHCSAIVSCLQAKKQSSQFKLIVRKPTGGGTITYDLEANSAQEAGDVCMRIGIIVQLFQRQAAASS